MSKVESLIRGDKYVIEEHVDRRVFGPKTRLTDEEIPVPESIGLDEAIIHFIRQHEKNIFTRGKESAYAIRDIEVRKEVQQAVNTAAHQIEAHTGRPVTPDTVKLYVPFREPVHPLGRFFDHDGFREENTVRPNNDPSLDIKIKVAGISPSGDAFSNLRAKIQARKSRQRGRKR